MASLLESRVPDKCRSFFEISKQFHVGDMLSQEGVYDVSEKSSVGTVNLVVHFRSCCPCFSAVHEDNFDCNFEEHDLEVPFKVGLPDVV